MRMKNLFAIGFLVLSTASAFAQDASTSKSMSDKYWVFQCVQKRTPIAGNAYVAYYYGLKFVGTSNDDQRWNSERETIRCKHAIWYPKTCISPTVTGEGWAVKEVCNHETIDRYFVAQP